MSNVVSMFKSDEDMVDELLRLAAAAADNEIKGISFVYETADGEINVGNFGPNMESITRIGGLELLKQIVVDAVCNYE